MANPRAPAAGLRPAAPNRSSAAPLLAAGESVAWTDRIVVRDSEYRKIVQGCAASGEPCAEREVPLFSVDRRTRRLSSTINISISRDVAKRAKLLEEPLELEFLWSDVTVLDPKEAARLFRHVPLPSSPTNPLLKIRHRGLDVVLDTVSLLQFGVAPNRTCFELLMSPFRDVAAWGVRRQRLHVLSVWQKAFRSFGPGLADGAVASTSFSRACGRAMAFWLCCPRRRSALEQVSHSIQAGGPLYVPKVPTWVHASCVGWRSKGAFLVQTLVPERDGDNWRMPGEMIVVVDRMTGRPSVVADSPHLPLDVCPALFAEDDALFEFGSALAGCRSPSEAELLLEQVVANRRASLQYFAAQYGESIKLQDRARPAENQLI